MKCSVIVLACVLAIAAAQFNDGRYVPDNYNYNRYNRYQYNNPYNRFQQIQNGPYRNYVSSTQRPFFYSSTAVPSTIAPTPFTFKFQSSSAAPSVVAPVSSVAAPAPLVAVPAPSVAAPAPSVAAPAEPILLSLVSSLSSEVKPSAAPEASAVPEVAITIESSSAPEVPTAAEVSAVPEVSAALETSAAPEVAAVVEVSAAPEVPANVEASAAPEVPAVVEVSAAPEVSAVVEASAAPEVPAVVVVSAAPEVSAVVEASAAPEPSAAPKIAEKPAPVILIAPVPAAESAPAPAPSKAPLVVSYVKPVAPIVPVAPIAPVAPVAPAAAFVNIPGYVSNPRDAETIRYGNDISPNGAFNYFFESNSGIAAQAEGIPRTFYSGADEVAPIVEQGSFAWISPEGQEISISYVADENGYQPTGNAIPQAPEIPPAILRSLEFIARSLPAAAAVSSK